MYEQFITTPTQAKFHIALGRIVKLSRIASSMVFIRSPLGHIAIFTKWFNRQTVQVVTEEQVDRILHFYFVQLGRHGVVHHDASILNFLKSYNRIRVKQKV